MPRLARAPQLFVSLFLRPFTNHSSDVLGDPFALILHTEDDKLNPGMLEP